MRTLGDFLLSKDILISYDLWCRGLRCVLGDLGTSSSFGGVEEFGIELSPYQAFSFTFGYSLRRWCQEVPDSSEHTSHNGTADITGGHGRDKRR